MSLIAHIGKGYWPRVRVGKKYAVVLINIKLVVGEQRRIQDAP